MQWLEEQNFGRLLQYFRENDNRSVQEVAAKLGYTSSWLSKIENNQATRPEIERVYRFAGEYRLTLRLRSYLLRAADYPPSDENITELLVAMRPELSMQPYPAFILDYRYQLIAWNPMMQRFYEGQLATQDLDSRSEQATEGTLGTGRTGGTPGEVTTDPSGTTGITPRCTLVLRPNLSFLDVLFNPSSCLFLHMKRDDWDRLSEYFLVRFWRAMMPLMQPHWYEAGQPAWLQEELTRLGSLPDPAGSDFLRKSTEIQYMLKAYPSDPKAQLIFYFGYRVDTRMFQDQHQTFRVMPNDLLDGRFTLFSFLPQDRRN